MAGRPAARGRECEWLLLRSRRSQLHGQWRASSGAGRGSLHISGRRPIDLRDDVLAATGGIDGAEGGLIHVGDKINGGNAQFKLFGNSVLDISAHDRRRFVTDAIEGEGTIDLGAKTLS